MSCIIKRGNKWVAVYSDGNGNEIRRSTGVDIVPKVIPPGTNKKAVMAKNKATARLLADELEKSARFGNMNLEAVKAIAGERSSIFQNAKSQHSVKDYLNKWLLSRKGNIRALSRERCAINAFIRSLGKQSDIALHNVTPEHCQSFIDAELQRVSVGTVIRYVSTLTTIFRRAMESDIIRKNPFFGLMPTKTDHERDMQFRDAFTLPEVELITKTFPGEWADIVRVCLYTGGQRMGDIVTLKWCQIDLERGILRMQTQKNKRSMTKPIIEPLREVLERLLPHAWNDYVFPIAALKFLQADGTNNLSKEFTDLLRAHGLIAKRAPKKKKDGDDRRVFSEKSFHSLRATAVTVLRLAGVPVDLCRHIVGHSSEMVERLYFRPDTKSVANAMQHLVIQKSANA